MKVSISIPYKPKNQKHEKSTIGRSVGRVWAGTPTKKKKQLKNKKEIDLPEIEIEIRVLK